MDGHGVGWLQLAQHLGAVLHQPPVKVHGDDLAPGVHVGDAADVAVEDPQARRAAPPVLPHDVVVVLHLHDPVPKAEEVGTEPPLPLAGLGGVEGLLEPLVEGEGAALVLAGGG